MGATDEPILELYDKLFIASNLGALYLIYFQHVGYIRIPGLAFILAAFGFARIVYLLPMAAVDMTERRYGKISRVLVNAALTGYDVLVGFMALAAISKTT